MLDEGEDALPPTTGAVQLIDHALLLNPSGHARHSVDHASGAYVPAAHTVQLIPSLL